MLKVEADVTRLLQTSLALLLVATACDRFSSAEPEPTQEDIEEPEPVDAPPAEVAQPTEALRDPVPFWEGGEVAREIERRAAESDGLVVLELGEDWVPYLFSDRDPQTGEQIPNAFRDTYLALARGEIPDDHHGERASRDKYLELYGIPPTLGLLRERFRKASTLSCAADLDLGPLERFTGFVAYRDNDRARRDARRFNTLERQVRRWMEQQHVAADAELDESRIPDRELGKLREYRDRRDEVEAIRAAQARLQCEGYYEGRARPERGALDWVTHEALAEFERRHRVFGWGFIGRETIEMLRKSPTEVEREAVLRMLTERAMHTMAVIEDGSRTGTFVGADGQRHPIPNLEEGLREAIVSSLGLETPESTLAFLEGLGELTPGRSVRVALRGPALPEYYGPEMALSIEVDRGDVWYDFPFDAQGRQRAQGVQRRPRVTVFTQYRGQRIALARFGTTIGGWRSELVDGTVMWKYKQSEVGERVWSRIVAAPVWLPPESTPHRELLRRNPRRGRPGEPKYLVNYHETGPSYASAYGLVAAYHLTFAELPDGRIRLGHDEGIRMHGSVDYMSIMRRHSHGCHRMHNHIAVRLMSFVLRHRPHVRRGQQPMAFRRNLEVDGQVFPMAIDQGGYVFELVEPLRVNVLEGRILGERRTPIPHAIPKYDEEVGAYLMPDGSAVNVDRLGNLTPRTLPVDAGVPDAGPGGGRDGGVDAGNLQALLEALPM
ncbi:MAG: murein L,D-transpeptidase [Myxococcales bacterium]|nr:murein L,D-transpeptidase [Myxococcales bacterium]